MSLGELACLAGDKWSGVVHRRRSLYIALNKAADWGQEQLKRGILDYLTRRRYRATLELGGVLLGHGNIKANQKNLDDLDGSNYVHAEICADFYTFSPREGMIVRCVVLEKRKKHLECLVLGRYSLTAKIKKYKNGGMEEGIEVGQSVKVEVRIVSFVEDVPVMVGDLLEKDEKDEMTIEFVKFEGGIPVGEDSEACSGNSLKRKLEEEGDDDKKAAKKRRKEEKRRLKEIKRREENELSLNAGLHETNEEKNVESKIKEKVEISPGGQTEMLLAVENQANPEEMLGDETEDENKVIRKEKKKKKKENVKASLKDKLADNGKDDDNRDCGKSIETEETNDGQNRDKEAIVENIVADKDTNINKELQRKGKETDKKKKCLDITTQMSHDLGEKSEQKANVGLDEVVIGSELGDDKSKKEKPIAASEKEHKERTLTKDGDCVLLKPAVVKEASKALENSPKTRGKTPYIIPIRNRTVSPDKTKDATPSTRDAPTSKGKPSQQATPEKTSEANDRITRSKVVKGISAVDTTTTNLTDPTPAAESNNRVAPIFSEKENVAPNTEEKREINTPGGQVVPKTPKSKKKKNLEPGFL